MGPGLMPGQGTCGKASLRTERTLGEDAHKFRLFPAVSSALGKQEEGKMKASPLSEEGTATSRAAGLAK